MDIENKNITKDLNTYLDGNHIVNFLSQTNDYNEFSHNLELIIKNRIKIASNRLLDKKI